MSNRKGAVFLIKKRDKTDRIATVVPVFLMIGMLIVPELAVHMYVSSGKPETAAESQATCGGNDAADVSAFDDKSTYEDQYEELLQREQEVLEEIDRIENGPIPEKKREKEKMLALLRDEMHRIQLSKHDLEIRMEGEQEMDIDANSTFEK